MSSPSSAPLLLKQQEENGHFLSYAEYWNIEANNKTKMAAVTATDTTVSNTMTTTATTPTKNKMMISLHHDRNFNYVQKMLPRHKWLQKGMKRSEAVRDRINYSQILYNALTNGGARRKENT